tara:strand:- start:665 stop:1195 length:531 start_codon:yes stop_codon:yes gene_type:complete
MDFDKITQIRLLKEDYKIFERYPHYKIVYIDKKNYLQYTNELQTVNEYVNKQLPNWEESPTHNDIPERFNCNSHCLMFFYKDNPIGWNWSNPNVSIDWKNSIQELLDDELYAGGCFVTNLVKRPANAGLINYNMIFEYYLEVMGYNVIYGYIDNWNKAAFRVNYENGLKPYNFINE